CASEFCLGSLQKLLIEHAVGGTAAMQAMCTQYPGIAGPYDRFSRPRFRNGVLGREGRLAYLQGLIEYQLDLGHLEAGELDVEVHVDEGLQLDRQNFPIPACLLRNSVVRQYVRTLVGVTEMLEPQSRHLFEAQKLCGGQTSMSSYDPLLAVNEDRIHKPKSLDRAHDNVGGHSVSAALKKRTSGHL